MSFFVAPYEDLKYLPDITTFSNNYVYANYNVWAEVERRF